MTWWRRNGLWLVALPCAVAAMLAASSSRVETFWWQSGLHHELDHATTGDAATYQDTFTDLEGVEISQEATVRVVDVVPADSTLEGDLVPTGSAAYRVDLEFSAPADTDLAGCDVILMGADGARYGDRLFDPCVPEDDDVLTVRPPSDTWEASTVVVTDAEAELDEVWVAFIGWSYVRLDL